MTWLAVALSLSGNVGVILKRRWGFACWIAANLAWFADARDRADWPQATLWAVYLALALWGFVSWGEERS